MTCINWNKLVFIKYSATDVTYCFIMYARPAKLSIEIYQKRCPH